MQSGDEEKVSEEYIMTRKWMKEKVGNAPQRL